MACTPGTCHGGRTVSRALAVCFAREALRRHKETGPVSAGGQVIAALLGVDGGAQIALASPVLAAFVSEGVRAVLARLDAEDVPASAGLPDPDFGAEDDLVMMSNSDEDIGLVRRADASASAQEIANEDSRSVNVRDVLTDQLLATVHPQVAA